MQGLKQVIGTAVLLGVMLTSANAKSAPVPQVHVFTTDASAIFVNAYIIETKHSLILVDATLTESSSKALRKELDSYGKPLAAVVITHGHPDHYNGLTNILAGKGEVPVYALPSVTEVIRSHDADKETQWRPVFGAEWPVKRSFPNRDAKDGVDLRIDGVTLTPHALGPTESDADTIWTVNLGHRHTVAFVGDLVFNGTHSYTCDAHTASWLKALMRVGALSKKEHWAKFYPGHGAAGGAELLPAERHYLERLREKMAAVAPGTSLSKDDLTQLTEDLHKDTGATGLEFLVSNCAPSVLEEIRHAHP